MKPKVQLITDGSSTGKVGPGGWAAILKCEKPLLRKEWWANEQDTTNNRMELKAVIQGLKMLKMPCQVELIADSEYVGLGITQRLQGWKAEGWRTHTGKPVKNLDLWLEIEPLIALHEITFTHVDGHTGHVENEQANQLAQDARALVNNPAQKE